MPSRSNRQFELPIFLSFSALVVLYIVFSDDEETT